MRDRRKGKLANLEFLCATSARVCASAARAFSVQRPRPGRGEYPLTYETRPEGFELPSLLNLGMSYDIYFGAQLTDLRYWATSLRTLSRKTKWAAGLNMRSKIYAARSLSLRVWQQRRNHSSYETGLSAGVAVQVPLSKTNKNSRLGIEYGYRQTRVWNGTHNFGIRFGI